MGFFVHDDPEYNEGQRMVGFNRYKQLLSFHGVRWIQVNLITTLGVLPFAALCTISILSSSSLLMMASGVIGGMIFAPFLAALMTTIMKGLMDDTGFFWQNYKKSWKQNWKSSLIPGAIFGLFASMFIFMAYLMYYASIAPGYGTIGLYLFGLLLFLAVNTLFWPQFVLFDQTIGNRIRNMILFGSKYLWKVVGVSFLQMVWIAILFLFSPFTLLVIPFLGFWYIIFLSQLILYENMNYELQIEKSYGISR